MKKSDPEMLSRFSLGASAKDDAPRARDLLSPEQHLAERVQLTIHAYHDGLDEES
jgi:hypothetical protein